MRTIITGGLLACLLGNAPLQAEPYPDRPITIVVPFGKGTTADFIAAVVSDAVSKDIGQKITVELKPGAGGGGAMEQVEKATPDGCTLAMITQGTHVFNLGLYKTLRYDPRKIIPITPIAAVSNVTTVHPSNPANTPPLDASGLKGNDLVTWFGFGAPAGTPPEIVQRLRDEFAKAAAEPAVKAKLNAAGLDPIDQMQPAEFARLITSDLATWTPIIKAAGASAE
jgi:tripartite-type tricarboxylate transporter receptor subunit TctC